jgi:hypothetical protein
MWKIGYWRWVPKSTRTQTKLPGQPTADPTSETNEEEEEEPMGRDDFLVFLVFLFPTLLSHTRHLPHVRVVVVALRVS